MTAVGTIIVVLGNPAVGTVRRAVARLGADQHPSVILGVVAPPPRVQRGIELPDDDNTIVEALVASRRARLEALARQLPCPCPVEIEQGPAARCVVDAVRSHDAARVVVVGDGSGPTRASIARIIVVCPVPLSIEPAVENLDGPNVLAALDLDDELALNRSIVEAGAAAAAVAGGDLHLVHAWELTGERELLESGRLSQAEIGALGTRVRQAHEDGLSGLVVELGLSEVRRHLVQGEPIEVVGRIAAANAADLVVMGTAGQVDVHDIFTHSNARAAAERLDLAVMVLRPESFRSPL